MESLETMFEEAIETNNAEQLAQIKQEIIKNKNATLAYKFAMECEDETKHLQKIVIKSGDAQLIYLFARDVFGAEIEKLEKAIIETENTEVMQNFADIEGANRKKLLKKIKQIEEN